MSHGIRKDVPWNTVGLSMGLSMGLLCTHGKIRVTPHRMGNPYERSMGRPMAKAGINVKHSGR